uniref:Panacea domain-containing protein n=1 Tax=uncultured Erythrobacter sp. TaxID=263913 RepID=UPI0026158F53|nr:type II toxin-antitoxin system antitoxin SocA domain-containing protein [uncultured Erythrobacter sp.]
MPNVNEIADWFIARVDRGAGDTITHLKLQKLLYFAQSWYLANTGEELFQDDFQAWAHGPVVRSIYDRFSEQKWAPIGPVEAEPDLDDRTVSYLEQLYRQYGQYGAKELERRTHEHDPWKNARGDLPPEARCEKVIEKAAMRDFYGEKIGKKWDS